MRDVRDEIAPHPIDPAQIADVVQDEHGAISFGASRRGLRAENARPARWAHRVERHLYRRAMFAFERGAKLADDPGLAHRFDIMTAQQIAFEIEHAARRVVCETQPSIAVDHEHPFNHARQNRCHSRAIRFQLVQSPQQLGRFAADPCLEVAHAPPGDGQAEPMSAQPGRYRNDEVEERIEHRYGSASL